MSEQDQGVAASPPGQRRFAVEPASAVSSIAATPNAVAAALLSVVDAVRDYLPPDGIDAQTFIGRVIGATDNPEINPHIRELENGRS